MPAAQRLGGHPKASERLACPPTDSAPSGHVKSALAAAQTLFAHPSISLTLTTVLW